jgi:hypothetical protein
MYNWVRCVATAITLVLNVGNRLLEIITTTTVTEKIKSLTTARFPCMMISVSSDEPQLGRVSDEPQKGRGDVRSVHSVRAA